MRACVFHVDAQMRTFLPTTQQQHTFSRHMSRICACACRGKNKHWPRSDPGNMICSDKQSALYELVHECCFVYPDLSCGTAFPQSQVHTHLNKYVSHCWRCRTILRLAQHALQFHATASIQILRNTHAYAISQQGPVDVISQKLKRITLGAHVIHQRLH